MFIERYKFIELLKSIHSELELCGNTISLIELEHGHFFKNGEFYNSVHLSVNGKENASYLYSIIKASKSIKLFETINNANLVLSKYKDKQRLVVNY